MDNEETIELLANYAHEAWSGWMSWMFSRGSMVTVQVEGEEIEVWTMPPSLYERWQRQMNTAYVDLSDSEKESDREEARKIMNIILRPTAIEVLSDEDREEARRTIEILRNP